MRSVPYRPQAGTQHAHEVMVSRVARLVSGRSAAEN